MKKSLTVLLSLIIACSAFSQSKKEQIETLTFQLDSLQRVIFKERESKDSINQVLNTDINKKKEEINTLNSVKIENQKDLALKDSEISLLKDKMKLALDSLHLLGQTLESYKNTIQSLSASKYEGASYVNEVQAQQLFSRKYEKVSYYDGTKLLKFQKYPMSNTKIDIVDWLNNFTKTSESRLVYNYDSDPIDWMGPLVLVTELYENGIIVEKYLGYESQNIIIKLPFLSKESAILLFSKLDLSSFEACFEPTIEVQQGFAGAIVSFGSGC
jgi:hypothetical protein